MPVPVKAFEKVPEVVQNRRRSDAGLSFFDARVSVWGWLRCVCVAGVSVVVAGCLPPQTREDVQRDWDKGVADWQATDWNHMVNQITGLPLAPEGAGRAESVTIDDRLLCLNQNSEERVISENGVSDYVQYRRCPVSPYPTRSLGERLSPGHVDPVELNEPLN
jgi:hypothetical protein